MNAGLELPSFVKIVMIAIEDSEQATDTVGLAITCFVYPIMPRPPPQKIMRTSAWPILSLSKSQARFTKTNKYRVRSDPILQIN